MFTRPKRPSHTIDLAPLIDVVFLLLVFFMLTSSFSPPALPLQLPKAQGDQTPESNAVVVSLDSEGILAVDGEVIAFDDFEVVLRRAVEATGSPRVHFRGDQTAEYGRFLGLMDRARRVGVEQFHLVHDFSQAGEP